MPYTLNPDFSLTITAADPSLADNYQPIQDAIDFLANNYGGGKLWLPRTGSYNINSTLVLKEAVELHGHSRVCSAISVGTNDIGAIRFDASCKYAAIRDIFVVGKFDPLATSNVVSVADNVPVNIARCQIWGGGSALYHRGVDGSVEDCFITGWGQNSILSNGANWYKRVKADTTGQPCVNAFYQGGGLPGGAVMENHFEQCDFSGQYTNSIYIADGGVHTAFTSCAQCVFAAPIRIIGAKHTAFDNCAIGSPTFQLSSGSCNIVGSYGYSAMSVPGASKAGNTNIS